MTATIIADIQERTKYIETHVRMGADRTDVTNEMYRTLLLLFSDLESGLTVKEHTDVMEALEGTETFTQNQLHGLSRVLRMHQVRRGPSKPQLSELELAQPPLQSNAPSAGTAQAPGAPHQGPESAVSEEQRRVAYLRAVEAWEVRGPPNRNTAEGNGELRRVLEDVCGMVTLWDNFSGKPIMLEHDGGGNLARILVPKDEADRWGPLADAPVLDPEQVETGCGPQVPPHKFLEAIGQEGPIRVEYTEAGYPKNLWTPFWHDVAEPKQVSDVPAAEPARLITGDILRMAVARHRRLKAICQAAAPAPEAEAEAAEGGNTEKQKRAVIYI